MSLDTLRAKLDRRSIPALDGVRAIAVLIVILYHLHLKHLRWWPDGSFGVLVFFVLSGFLITWLLLKEADETDTVSIRGFYWRRCLRIFPAFYCCAALSIATLVISGMSVPHGSTTSALLYFGDYYFPFHENDTFLGFTWSLAVEEQFYLIWPFVFLAFHRNRRVLAKGMIVAIFCTWAWRAVLKFVLHAPEHYISYAFDCHIDHLMMGALSAVALRSGWLRSFWDTVCRPQWALASIGLLALSISAQRRFGHGYDQTIGFAADPLVIAVLLPQLISLEKVAPFSLLNLPIARFLGRISYPLYLYHIYAIEATGRMLAGKSIAVTVIAAVAFSVALASGSYYFIERPFLRLKNRSTRRPGRCLLVEPS